ncbi:hypothetical protein PTTG_04557 [Puccinia triticina 1-1 BBBD Race 1]|uniref:Uncharacterized protein n=1 Tax=Puccinia triticina (isolate 1-1 / race 1 (BBBD)) TaxID=630390 RepID=A0A180H2Z8_PUCT1|nr:hypothetical protein PTTG_04557 [Puccinia triticina 1-1 BBBD Race 1]
MNHPRSSILIKHADGRHEQAAQAQQLGKTRTEADKLDLMPFSIDYHGPAEISKYFLTRPAATASNTTPSSRPEEADDQHLEFFEGSFRGRYLHGTRLKIPDGYSGLVLSSPDPTPQSSHPSDQPGPPIVAHRSTGGTRTSTARGRGRGRGRARGRRLAQAAGTRAPPVTRFQRKRKQNDVPGFLDSDDDDESGDEDEGAKKTDRQATPDASHARSSGPGLQPAVKQEDTAADRPPSATRETDPMHLPSPSSSLQKTEDAKPDPPPILPPPPTDLPAPSSSPSTTQSSKVLRSIGRFDHITLWNVDDPLDLSQDIYARALNEWVGLSNLIHSLPSTTT